MPMAMPFFAANSFFTTLACSPLFFLVVWGASSSSSQQQQQPAAQVRGGQEEGPLMVNPCQNTSSTFSKLPFCDASLPIDQRVDDIIRRLNVTDKIQLMRQDGPALPQLGLNGYRWWEEATHGISPPRNSKRTAHETNFALPITTSMSFNRTLWRTTGEHISKEARAFANVGDEYSTFWTPVVNLAREPRWGRNLETPGEDPYLSGEYAASFVHGFQNNPEDPAHIMNSACCKHYVANEMDGSTVAGYHSDRDHFDAKVSMQDLVDSYMLPFQACVEKGGVTSLMCSYNSVNGVPSCANDWLLKTVARESWNFDGAIVSDCDADSDVFNTHHFTNTPEESVRDVLRAGTDVDCGTFVTDKAASALAKGLITESDLDERLRQQFRLRMRLGHFDPPSPLDAIMPEDVVCTDHAKRLAMDGAAQGATLLKNENKTLPLRRTTSSDTASSDELVVINPLDNEASLKQLANYYGGSQPCDGTFWSLAETIAEQVTHKSRSFLGLDNATATNISAEAIAAAAGAQRVILGLGTDLTLAREGQDASSIELPPGQMRLLEEVCKVVETPIIVVLFTATPLDIRSLLSNPKVGAVLLAGQPSVAVRGLGDVIFGVKVPAGRTVQTMYPKEYADEVSIFDFNMRPGPSEWPRPDCTPSKGSQSACPKGTNPGRTHRFYTGEAVIPFGFGLSYTTFKYEVVSSPRSIALTRDIANGRPRFVSEGPEAIAYAVNVTNIGNHDADEVVLGFLKPPMAGQDGVPLQSLFAFERVHVKVGQIVTVWLYPSERDFLQANEEGNWNAHEGRYVVEFGLQSASKTGSNLMAFATTAVDVRMDLDSIFIS